MRSLSWTKEILLASEDLVPLAHEEVHVFLLDGRNRCIRRVKVAAGWSKGAQIFNRDIFREAVIHSAVSIVLVHNHPTEGPSPSIHDRQTTANAAEAGRVLDIPLRDHIIVSSKGWYSFFAQNGWFREFRKACEREKQLETAELHRLRAMAKSAQPSV